MWPFSGFFDFLFGRKKKKNLITTSSTKGPDLDPYYGTESNKKTVSTSRVYSGQVSNYGISDRYIMSDQLDASGFPIPIDLEDDSNTITSDVIQTQDDNFNGFSGGMSGGGGASGTWDTTDSNQGDISNNLSDDKKDYQQNSQNDYQSDNSNESYDSGNSDSGSFGGGGSDD